MSIEDYKTGCKYCQHLMNMGQGNYRCVEIMYDDETPIYPYRKKKRTEDYRACEGDCFLALVKKKRKIV